MSIICPFCGTKFLRQTISGTIMWACGSWKNESKNLLEQSTKCQILTLSQEVKDLKEKLENRNG